MRVSRLKKSIKFQVVLRRSVSLLALQDVTGIAGDLLPVAIRSTPYRIFLRARIGKEQAMMCPIIRPAHPPDRKFLTGGQRAEEEQRAEANEDASQPK